MGKGRARRAIRQFSGGGIKNAVGTLPGDNDAAAKGKAENIGDGSRNSVSGRKATVRAIENWVNEGGADGESYH